MVEGPRALLLREGSDGPGGETVPPVSKSQPASSRVTDPHESVTIAPAAAGLERLPSESPGPSFGHAELGAALAIGSKAGTSLSELSNTTALLGDGVQAALQAYAQLQRDLAELQALIGPAGEQQLSLSRRVTELERELLETRQAAERERHFLTREHDAFIASLLEDHEKELASRASAVETRRLTAEASDLARRLFEVDAARTRAEAECERARHALAETVAQRDEAQARAEKRERERDELRAEASQLRARLGTHRTASTMPPPAIAPRPPSYRPPSPLRLDSGELNATLHARLATPLASGALRHTPPPAEFQRAIPSGWTPPPAVETPQPITVAPPRPRAVSAASLPAGAIPTPPLKQKPDPATRPLIDYSIGHDGVESETLEGVRFSSKPPRK